MEWSCDTGVCADKHKVVRENAYLGGHSDSTHYGAKQLLREDKLTFLPTKL